MLHISELGKKKKVVVLQSYTVNLLLTAVLARVAMLPHPNLHEFMLDPFLELSDGVKTVYSTLRKVSKVFRNNKTIVELAMVHRGIRLIAFICKVSQVHFTLFFLPLLCPLFIPGGRGCGCFSQSGCRVQSEAGGSSQAATRRCQQPKQVRVSLLVGSMH